MRGFGVEAQVDVGAGVEHRVTGQSYDQGFAVGDDGFHDGPGPQIKHRQQRIEAFRAPRVRPRLRTNGSLARILAVKRILESTGTCADRSRTNRCRTWIGAISVCFPRSGPAPCRTTRWRPSASRSSENRATKPQACHFQHRHQPAARAIAGDLRRWVNDRTSLAEGDDRGIVRHRRIAPLEVLAGFDTSHDTPPSQIPSPGFMHSSGHLAGWRCNQPFGPGGGIDEAHQYRSLWSRHSSTTAPLANSSIPACAGTGTSSTPVPVGMKANSGLGSTQAWSPKRSFQHSCHDCRHDGRARREILRSRAAR